MSRSFDVIVVGLGAMGSAAADHLAGRGLRVLGLDRFHPPHDQGSSHGQTRIIREAYFEHPAYVPLVQRAYENWAQLEGETVKRLFQQTGGLMIGPPESDVVSGSECSAKQHNLTYELLSAADVRKRFPALLPTDDMVAVWEPRAGVLFVDACIEAQLERARQQGATLRFEEPVTSWQVEGNIVQVVTPQGTYRAEKLLLTVGAWLSQLLSDLGLPLQVERQVLYWFEPKSNAGLFQPDHCPIHLFEYEPRRYVYGFPDLGHGVKVALHHEGEITDPDTVRRDVSHDETRYLQSLLDRFLPDANGTMLDAAVCLYTNTPDFHFLLDQHPKHDQVFIASPCSGHGFKFASALGEILADLLIAERCDFDLSLFRLNQF